MEGLDKTERSRDTDTQNVFSSVGIGVNLSGIQVCDGGILCRMREDCRFIFDDISRCIFEHNGVNKRIARVIFCGRILTRDNGRIILVDISLNNFHHPRIQSTEIVSSIGDIHLYFPQSYLSESDRLSDVTRNRFPCLIDSDMGISCGIGIGKLRHHCSPVPRQNFWMIGIRSIGTSLRDTIRKGSTIQKSGVCLAAVVDVERRYDRRIVSLHRKCTHTSDVAGNGSRVKNGVGLLLCGSTCRCRTGISDNDLQGIIRSTTLRRPLIQEIGSIIVQIVFSGDNPIYLSGIPYPSVDCFRCSQTLARKACSHENRLIAVIRNRKILIPDIYRALLSVEYRPYVSRCISRHSYSGRIRTGCVDTIMRNGHIPRDAGIGKNRRKREAKGYHYKK